MEMTSLTANGDDSSAMIPGAVPAASPSFCCRCCNFVTFLTTCLSVTSLTAIIVLSIFLSTLRTQIISLQNALEAEHHDVQTLQKQVLVLGLNENSTSTTSDGAILNVTSALETLNTKVEQEENFTLYHVAGTFTLLTGVICLLHMTSHLRSFQQPTVQRKILTILWFCPIYSVTSFLSLVFPFMADYLSIIKDCYEAYIIYTFLSFLIAVLGRRRKDDDDDDGAVGHGYDHGGGGDREAVVDVLEVHASHLQPPMRCLRRYYHPDPNEGDRAMANAVLLECQILAMQFVFLRPLTSIALFLYDTLDIENAGDGSSDASASAPSSSSSMSGSEDADDMTSDVVSWVLSARFWIVMVQNVSVYFAFRGLLKFYHAVHEDLAWCQPFAKFVTVKGIVFLTFWQGLLLSVLAHAIEDRRRRRGHYGGGGGQDEFDPRAWAEGVQNLLICVEMLLFSAAHFCVFPVEEWEEGYRPDERNTNRFGDHLGVRDFVSDVRHVVRSGKSHSRRKQRIGQDYAMAETSSDATSLEDELELTTEDQLVNDDNRGRGDGIGIGSLEMT